MPLSTLLIKDKKRKTIPRGDEAKTTRIAHGTFAKKNNIIFFGWKLHTKQDVTFQLIIDFKLTPAHVHDSKINLCKAYEVDYKDKGYFKKKYRQYNGGMTRAVRNKPLIYWEKQRNKRIARKRAPVERPYSFLNRINNSHTRLTTTERNEVEITILSMIFNMEQLITLKKQEKQEQEKKEREEHEQTISFNFFNNNIYYYENSSLINFLTQRSTNEEIIKTIKKPKNVKKNNTPSMSKSDYRRSIKRKIKKIRKQKKKTLQKNYKKLKESLNEFNLTTT